VRGRDVALLGLALLASAGLALERPEAIERPEALERPDEAAIEITRVGAKSPAGGGVLRLTLSATVASAWEEANLGFLAMRSYGKQSSIDTATARGRELDVALPAEGCSLLVADLGGPEDRGHADSWRRSRRSLKAVFCQDTGNPAADLTARRRAAAIFLASAGTRDEVRPLANPATTRPGCDLPLRLYADGRPAPGVRAVAEGPNGGTSGGVSDAHGFAVVSLPVAGAWRVYFRTGEDRIAELLFDVPDVRKPWVDGGAP
jgi:hypothetical protein